MKKILLGVICYLLIAGLSGCTTLKRLTGAKPRLDNKIREAILTPYSGDKARIAVADFDVNAAKATGEIGGGLREILANMLINSNRFSVVERQAANAGVIVSVSVTEFEPEASGGKAGIGGGGGAGSGILGGLLSTVLNKAHMALDIRISDLSTTEVLGTSRVQGQASDIAAGMTGGSLFSGNLGMGLAAYANTPMEKAIRICIIEAVRYIAQTIPDKYYKN